jgi:hypothetical protein
MCKFFTKSAFVSSSRLASELSWDAGMLVLASVSRVLASALAFWPVLGWTPSLIAKLLGLGTSSLIQTTFFPLEPKEAISVFWILVIIIILY